MSATLPPAVDAFTAAVGEDKVFTDETTLREFRDPFQPPASDAYAASAVVMPTTVEEVQAVLAVANEHGVPLWTHGQGRNNGYGGGAPRVSGSVIVSLRNMNRILEINEELGYACVEPGVRWFDLYEAIQAAGHKLTVSIPDLGWGSVVGNTLDHGMSYMPYGVDQGAQCGMEVVLADGTVMRTGMGAMPGNKSWHCYKRGLGPTPDQLFMQSNFGIVTNGLLAHAGARDLHAAVAEGAQRRRSRTADRHAAPADARRHDPDGSPDRQRRRCRVGHVAAHRLVGRRRPDPGGDAAADGR